ncbi:MAG: hypothetical protein LZF61_00135 [Nitrosomonas sp.]|nr:MAG: hypothetical protein LZF61_00135 [Nitrosomonas sp.]
MTDANGTSTGDSTHAPSSPKPINIQMQTGEREGIPVYANFSTINTAQNMVVVDFGFIDPSVINTLTQAIKSGNKTPGVINARSSCRLALSTETAQQLTQQLNQLLHQIAATAPRPANTQEPAAATHAETQSAQEKAEDSGTSKKESSGIRFPWFKKK